MKKPEKVIAIDWSGALDASAQRRGIQTAVCEVATGAVEVMGGRLRSEVELWLTEMREPVVVGLDFSFSFPEWFVRELGCASAPEVWARVARDGERWLREGHTEFWGRKKDAGPPLAHGGLERPGYRECEKAAIEKGRLPRSSFQVGGAGAVGTGTLRGMPMLGRLREAGWRVWPFDAPGLPMLLEIYPRLLTGPVVKRRVEDRTTYLRQPEFAGLALAARAAAEGSEDAFDAAISALRMRAHSAEFTNLPVAEERMRLEGAIWRPVPHAKP